MAHELGPRIRSAPPVMDRPPSIWGRCWSLLFTAMCVFLNGPLIAFFKLNSPQVNADARIYLVIVALGFLFSFFNQIFTGLFTAMGGSVMVLRSTAVGLVGNISCWTPDDLRGGPFPRMEVAGAAAATVLAQAIVTAMFLLAARRETILSPHPSLPAQPEADVAGAAADRPSGIYPEYVFLQPLHVDRADRGRMGRCGHRRLKRWVPRSNPSPIPRRRALPPR